MAEETEVRDPEYAEWLNSLEALESDAPEVEAAEEQADAAEVEAIRVAHKTDAKVEQFITEQKVASLETDFEKNATQEAKDLLAIYRTGDEDPKALKRLMALAVTKAGEIEKTKGVPVEEVEQEAEKRAAQMAQSEYGVGPLSSGGRSSSATPQEVFDSTLAKAHETKDTRLHYRLWADLPTSGEVSQPD